MRGDPSHGNPDHEDLEAGEPWDANDPRRSSDPLAPPTEACECFCLHCRRTFSSERIWFQKINGSGDGLDGFWKCPTPNCEGAGFTFDIFPTDPEHPANEGWWFDDEYNDDEEEEALEKLLRGPGSDVDEPFDYDEEFEDDVFDFLDAADADSDAEYDPEEPAYKILDEFSDDEDLEGEEWKYGLQPGERPESVRPDWIVREDTKYEEPDERPRELDWSDSELYGGIRGDEDIPF